MTCGLLDEPLGPCGTTPGCCACSTYSVSMRLFWMQSAALAAFATTMLIFSGTKDYETSMSLDTIAGYVIIKLPGAFASGDASGYTVMEMLNPDVPWILSTHMPVGGRCACTLPGRGQAVPTHGAAGV